MAMSRTMIVALLTLGACAANQGMAAHPPVVPERQLQLGLRLGIEAAFTDVRNDYDCIENDHKGCPAPGDMAMLRRASLGLATSAPQTMPWLLVGFGVGEGCDVQAGVSPHGAELTSHWRLWSGSSLGFSLAGTLRYSWSVSMITPLDDVLALDHYRVWSFSLPLDVDWQVPRGPLLFGGPLAAATHYDLAGDVAAMPLDGSQGPLSGWTRRLGGHFGSAWDWDPVELRTDITVAALATPESTYDGYVAFIDLTLLLLH